MYKGERLAEKRNKQTFFNQFQCIKDFLFFKLFRLCAENYVGLRVLFAFLSFFSLNRQIKELHHTTKAGTLRVHGHKHCPSLTCYKRYCNKHEKVPEDLIKQLRVLKKCKNNFDCLVHGLVFIESLNKPRRRQRERHQTKGLMSRTMAVHVRYKFLYISFPFSAKQHVK